LFLSGKPLAGFTPNNFMFSRECGSLRTLQNRLLESRTMIVAAFSSAQSFSLVIFPSKKQSKLALMFSAWSVFFFFVRRNLFFYPRIEAGPIVVESAAGF